MMTSHLRRTAIGPNAGSDDYSGEAGRRLDAWMTSALGQDVSGMSQANRRPADLPTGSLPQDPAYATLLEATSASERRAIDTAAKTASALGSVASWIERAQQQLTETTSAASRAQEEAASVLNQAVGSLGRRLNDVERKVVEAKPAAPDGTLEAIQRLERRLAAQADPAKSSKTEFEQALKGFEARLADIGEKIAGAPRPIGRRGLTETAEIDGAVAEIRSRQAAIEKGADRAMLPALGTLARSQTAILTSLKADVTRIAARMDEAAPERAAEVVREGVREGVETIRGSMSEVATRDDLGRLERSIGSLTHDIAELRKAAHEAASAESLEELQREVGRLATANAGPGVAARDMELLSRKLDIVAASGVDPGLIGSLARQVDEVRQLLSKSAAPQALSLVNRHLADLQREIGEVGGRQVAPGEFTALKDTVDEMRTALVAFGRQAAERRPDPAPDAVRAIEPMLSALVDRLERVEQRAADPEALHGLERQLETLASRIGQSPIGTDPGIAGLERSVNALLSEAASWRDGAVEAAERAARTAVGELAGTLQQGPDVERHLVELREHFDAAEERTFQSLETVHAALEAAMSRITSLESEGTRTTHPLERPAGAARPTAPTEPPRVPPTARPEPAVSALPAAPPKGAVPKRPVPAVAIASPDEADIPLPPAPEDEVLLEPGAARPTASAGARSPAASTVAPPGDIKSSFIAAARRAAQAAAAEGSPRAAAPRTRPSEGAKLAGLSRLDLADRLRRMIGDRRRTLLLGAAALLLALGTVQITRSLGIGGSQTPSATRMAEIAAPPPRVAPVARPGPLAAVPSTPAAPAAPASPPAVPAGVPDPVTTQSVVPRAPAVVQPEAAPPSLPVLAAAPPTAIGRPPGDKSPERVLDVPTRVAALPGQGLATPVTAPALQPGLKQAALAGDPVALYELAARTIDGRGVARDQKAAAALFEKAAEKGLAPAQYRIGNMYERGIGVDRNPEMAKSWYRKAAEAGNVRAMHNLAVLLAEGGVGKSDYQAALGWFTRAAERGIRDSQFNLAVLYARGLGTPQDLSKAYHWLALVAAQGDEDAGKKRDEVGGRLSGADLARAKAEVARWRPLPATSAANEVQVPVSGWPEPPVKRASRVTNL